MTGNGNGNGTAAPPNRVSDLLGDLKLNPVHVPVAEEGAPPDETASYGMHGVTKSVDVWFEYRVNEVKQEALQHAQEWAQAAIPKVDVVYAEIPPETILARRCSEAMRRWRERLVNKVQDTINQLTGRIGVSLVEYRDGLATLVQTRARVDELQDAARRKSVSLAETDGSAEIVTFMKGWWKYLLIAALVFADWVANVPVFYELLPKDGAADQALQELLERTEAQAIFGGIMRMFYRFLHSPEASILALTVVLFLMIFGHKLGESLREVVAVRDEDAPTIRTQIRSRRRQFFPPLILSAAGVLLLVFVLYSSREMLVSSTRDRLAEERQTLVETQQARDAGLLRSDLSDDAKAALVTAAEDQAVMVQAAQDRVRYATNLNRANVAIMLLNLVLALSAMLIGYLSHTGMIGGRQENPELAGIKQRISELQVHAARTRLDVQRAESRITDDLSELDRLICAYPLAGWEAKADRLKSVVQLFRSENARLRGIDSANILAFRKPIEIDWPEIGADFRSREPSEVSLYRQEFARLREDLQKYDRNVREQVMA